MLEELQIKALAELDGCYFGNTTYDTEEAWRKFDGCPCQLPNYLTSYDAIILLIQKQTYDVRSLVEMKLNSKHFAITVMAPASELCEALLRATGKWIE